MGTCQCWSGDGGCKQTLPWEYIDPCFRVGAAEGSEIGLNLLIKSFCFSISLRVVGRG